MKYVEEKDVKSYLESTTKELEDGIKDLMTGEVSA